MTSFDRAVFWFLCVQFIFDAVVIVRLLALMSPAVQLLPDTR